MECARKRLDLIRNHLAYQTPEVVICSAFRSPLTKAKRGNLRDTPAEELIAQLIRHTLDHTKVDPAKIDDLVLGNVLMMGAGCVSARIGELMGGLPVSSSMQTINRLCSSGLQACATIANAIKAGQISIGLAGGVETMSQQDMMNLFSPDNISDNVFQCEPARNCLMSMGMTSDNVATQYGIPREKMDAMAVESHRRAAVAQEQGLFKSEIVPIKTFITGKDGKRKEIVVDQDDGIRKETTIETLKKLKPAFNPQGGTTAGNSSQVTDGAAIVLLASREAAVANKLPIVGRWLGFAVAGVPPEIMGIGPSVAIPKVLEQVGLKVSDIDLFELNEAFASQATYCCEKLGLDMNKVNVKGGAIALGHPLGCTGARLMATIIPEMKRRKARYGVISMCIGTGMGAAAVIENIDN